MRINLTDQVLALIDGKMESGQVIGLHDDYLTIVTKSGVRRIHRSYVGALRGDFESAGLIIGYCTHCAHEIRERDPHVFTPEQLFECWLCAFGDEGEKE